MLVWVDRILSKNYLKKVDQADAVDTVTDL